MREPDHHLGVGAPSFGPADRPDHRAIRGPAEGRGARPVADPGRYQLGLSAIIAKRIGIPVFHMEAGNRCFDDRVPEEVNRRVMDHCQRHPDALYRAQPRNLLREGFPRNAHLCHWQSHRGGPAAPCARSRWLDHARRLGLAAGRYFLRPCTARRTSIAERLERCWPGFSRSARALDVPVPAQHPSADARRLEPALPPCPGRRASPIRSASPTSWP